MSEKTEEPTPRKLRKAREDGDSPVSSAVVQGLGFVVALALLPALVVSATTRFRELVERATADPLRVWSPVEFASDVTTLSLPLVGAAALAALAAGATQSGGTVAFKKLNPDLSRANPVAGLKNLVTTQRLIGLARALVGATLVGYLATRLLFDHARDLAHSAGNIPGAAALAAMVSQKLAWIAALVGLGLGAVDLVVVHWSWRKRHRMTKDEVRREHKEAEGDPEIKAARMRAHREMLEGATLHAVRDATVLVVNPTHLATALKYDEDQDEAPRILASGRGELARKLVDAARAYGVPIVQDMPVARALSELEVGEQIPEALYEAVAEILREAWSHAEVAASGAE